MGAPRNWSAKLVHYLLRYIRRLYVKFGAPIPWSALDNPKLNNYYMILLCFYIRPNDRIIIIKNVIR